MRCPSCQAEVPAGRFCVECGHKLDGSGQPRPAPPAPASSPEAERRQLTVMFCDLVGSTALVGAARSGGHARGHPRLSGRCAGVVARFERPRRQVHGRRRARLLRLAAGARGRRRAGGAGRARRWSRRSAGCDAAHGAPLAARVGIATGLVVVGELIGEGAAQEQAVVGETPNLAARLQALAEPGSGGRSPRRRAGCSAACSSSTISAPQRLKGFAEPVARLAGARARAGREPLRGAADGGPDAAGRARARSSRCCCDRWEQAKDGEGQVVLLSGEPGIGKSRLVRGAARAARRRAAHAAALPVLALPHATARSIR